MEAKHAAMEDKYSKLKANILILSHTAGCKNIRAVVYPSQLIVPGIPPLRSGHQSSYRALSAKPAPGARPRAVIACVHSYKVKESFKNHSRGRKEKRWSVLPREASGDL